MLAKKKAEPNKSSCLELTSIKEVQEKEQVKQSPQGSKQTTTKYGTFCRTNNQALQQINVMEIKIGDKRGYRLI